MFVIQIIKFFCICEPYMTLIYRLTVSFVAGIGSYFELKVFNYATSSL